MYTGTLSALVWPCSFTNIMNHHFLSLFLVSSNQRHLFFFQSLHNKTFIYTIIIKTWTVDCTHFRQVGHLPYDLLFQKPSKHVHIWLRVASVWVACVLITANY